MQSYGLNVEEAEKELHPVFKIDPATLYQHLNKKVKLWINDKVHYTGLVYTIDPVTLNWVLLNKKDAKSEPGCDVCIVMSSTIKKVETLEEAIDDEEIAALVKLITPDVKEEVEIDLSIRKDSICRWFTTNRIPISQDGDILSVAGGVVTIQPPYRTNDCISSNEIVLCRIRQLLSNVPVYDT